MSGLNGSNVILTSMTGLNGSNIIIGFNLHGRFVEEIVCVFGPKEIQVVETVVRNSVINQIYQNGMYTVYGTL